MLSLGTDWYIILTPHWLKQSELQVPARAARRTALTVNHLEQNAPTEGTIMKKRLPWKAEKGEPEAKADGPNLTFDLVSISTGQQRSSPHGLKHGIRFNTV